MFLFLAQTSVNMYSFKITTKLSEHNTEPFPYKINYLFHKRTVCIDKQIHHSWNELDSSVNISLKESNSITMKRNYTAKSSDCIRSKIGYSRGVHAWKIIWKKEFRGSHSLIGVATKKAKLHAYGYRAILGRKSNSWVWNISNQKIYAKNIDKKYPDMNQYETPDSFFMILDMDEGTLSFVSNGKYLGTAFNKLKNKKLYVIAQTVYGGSEITLQYLNSIYNPERLDILCSKKMGKNKTNLLKTCDFPFHIKKLLKIRNHNY